MLISFLFENKSNNFLLISFAGIARRKIDIDVNTISRALNKYDEI
jgi:hypothetical protein